MSLTRAGLSTQLQKSTSFPGVMVTDNANEAYWLASPSGGAADKILFYDHSGVALNYLSVGSGLTITGTVLDTVPVSPSYNIVQEEGVNINTSNTILNFVGLGITAADATGGVTSITLDSTLNSLSQFNSNGFITQTATDTFAARSILGTTNRITVTPTDGSANPVINISPSFGSSGLSDSANIALLNGTQVFSGANTFTNNIILNGVPTLGTHGVNKDYVDTLYRRPSVRVASTANLTLSGEQTIDTVLTSASYVLVKNQTAPAENGKYLSAAGAWTRTTDMDTAAKVDGTIVLIEDGTQKGQLWYTVSEVTTLGTDPIVWEKYATSVLDGSGIANQVAYWSSTTNLTGNVNFIYDGTYLTLGTTTPSSLSRLTTKGLGNSLSTYGIVHQALSGNEVFKVADNGAVQIGALGEIYLHPDAINLATGGTFPITVSGGDMYLNSDTTVLVEGGGTASNTPSFKSIATRSTAVGNLYNAQITGTINMTLGGTNPFSDLYIDTIVNQTLHTGPIRSIYVNPTLTAANNYIGIEINAPGKMALKTAAGNVSFNLGSDATGDLYYRNASGNLTRLPIGGAMEVLGSTGTVPAWTTTAGSLPGGANGDVLMYTGGTWVSATPVVEKQTGITGVGITLGATPLGSLLFILYRNGIYQDATDDYTILGNAITMVTALVATDKITAIYYT